MPVQSELTSPTSAIRGSRISAGPTMREVPESIAALNPVVGIDLPLTWKASSVRFQDEVGNARSRCEKLQRYASKQSLATNVDGVFGKTSRF